MRQRHMPLPDLLEYILRQAFAEFAAANGYRPEMPVRRRAGEARETSGKVRPGHVHSNRECEVSRTVKQILS